MDEQTRKLKADLLAGEILQLAHASLLLRLRFMEGALCRLEFAPMPRGTLWTDGRRFSYAPMHVLLRYRQERANPARDYLHAVLHCVFRHMYLHTRVQPQAWSLACDMVAEDLIADLRLRTTAVEREAEQQKALAAFRAMEESARNVLSLAALLHDIGKVPCTKLEDGKWVSPHHGSAGAQIARGLLWREFGLCGDPAKQRFREAVCLLIRYHT